MAAQPPQVSEYLSMSSTTLHHLIFSALRHLRSQDNLSADALPHNLLPILSKDKSTENKTHENSTVHTIK